MVECCKVLLSTVFVRELSYKLVVVGGGAGGCGTANKFANKLGKDQVKRVKRKFVGNKSETFMDFRSQ